MKAFLMHPDSDYDPQRPLPSQAEELTQDLGLNILFDSMAAGDSFLRDVARQTVLHSLTEASAILYRQQILTDAMANSDVVRGLYALSVEAIEREKHVWGWMTTRYANESLHRSVEVLAIFAELLERLWRVTDEAGSAFQSPGFRRFFAMLRSELDDAYLDRVRDHLERLAFKGGVLMSADLGPGNRGTRYILRRPPDAQGGWLSRLQEWVSHLGEESEESYTYEVAERDEAGFNALSELKSEGIASVAVALAQSTDHILSFFKLLHLELAFYVGCINLRERLSRKGEPVCIPVPAEEGETGLTCGGLYDAALSLTITERTVGNEISGKGKALLFLTGANRGGKSTLLRAIGQAQLMMQCGMFVPAESFRGELCPGVFTHFKREEDAEMRSGKLDEELARMSTIADRLEPACLMLMNESFASTNEREGSEIARQIVEALLGGGVRVAYVTHMYDLAHGFYREHLPNALFLRAERLAKGERTFRLLEGEPLPTSYGRDLYRRILEQESRTAEMEEENRPIVNDRTTPARGSAPAAVR
jgi:MutS domain V